ncbi:MAG: dienelactone hydrolase family protein [Myxococcota bacterium]
MKRLFASALLLVVGCDRPAPPPATEPNAPPPAASASAVPLPKEPAAEPPAPTRPRAGELHYVERILGDANRDDPLPMVVAIHGLGDDPDNFTHLFDAFAGPARLILPQGVDATDNGGWSWFPIRARSQDVEGLAAGIRSSADKIAGAIEALRASRPTVGVPIVTGFSQGGMLTFTLAIHHPDQVGHALPIGGWLPPPLWPEQAPTSTHPPIVAFHGTADNAVRYEPTAQAVQALVDKGYTVKLNSYEGVRHAIPPRMRTAFHDQLEDALRATTAVETP